MAARDKAMKNAKFLLVALFIVLVVFPVWARPDLVKSSEKNGFSNYSKKQSVLFNFAYSIGMDTKVYSLDFTSEKQTICTAIKVDAQMLDIVLEPAPETIKKYEDYAAAITKWDAQIMEKLGKSIDPVNALKFFDLGRSVGLVAVIAVGNYVANAGAEIDPKFKKASLALLASIRVTIEKENFPKKIQSELKRLEAVYAKAKTNTQAFLFAEKLVDWSVKMLESLPHPEN
jgi:hypothetical protein